VERILFVVVDVVERGSHTYFLELCLFL